VVVVRQLDFIHCCHGIRVMLQVRYGLLFYLTLQNICVKI